MTTGLEIRTLRDIETIELVPWEDRLHARTTLEMIQQGATLDPERAAIHFVRDGESYRQPISITHQALLGRTFQTANLLTEMGITSTDVTAVVMPNQPESHAILWGGQAAGIVHPINPLLEPRQIIALLEASHAKVMVAPGPDRDPETWMKAVEIHRTLPDIHVLRVGDEGKEGHSYHEMIWRYPDDHLISGRQIDGSDICAYFATGGTTGTPKLAMHTHLNETFEAWVIATVSGLSAGDVILSGLPMFHVNAVHITGLAPLSVGATIVVLGARGYRDQTVMQNFWKIAEHYRATSFGGVPTFYGALLQVPIDDADIRSVKHVRCGAAPMPVEVFKAFEARTGIKIIEGYGLTEGACSSTGNPIHGERRIGSVGLRYPYHQIRAVMLDDEDRIQRECAAEETGHVIMRGPHVFPGYLNPAHNRGVWTTDGWLKTGDLGRFDADGYLWLTGRAKDLIIRGGHNIDPAMIEEALYSHPEVALAAAVGQPDRHAGEIPVAYVQLKPGSNATAEEVMAHGSARIPERAAIPKYLYLLDEMPRTPIGKLFKPALRQDATRRALEMLLAEAQPESISGTVQTALSETGAITASIRLPSKSTAERQVIEERLREMVSRFTFDCTIEWSEDEPGRPSGDSNA